MGLSRRSIFIVACGLAAASMACGDSGTKADNSDASANGGGGDKTNGDGTNGNGTNGGQTNGGGTDGNSGNTSAPACMPGPCTCTDGAMGFAQCDGDTLGECQCSVDLSDAGLPPVAECPAKFTCTDAPDQVQGLDGFCVPSTPMADGGADDGGATGGTSGGTTGFGTGGLGGGAFPPMCATDDDCDKAGIDVKCSTLFNVFQVCLQPCVP